MVTEHDTLVGATYYDSVYEQEVTVRNVETDVQNPDPDDIDVELDYESIEESITVTLDAFRSDESIELVTVA
jgi:hypothetical protein